MNKKLVKIIGLFFLAVIVFSCVGRVMQSYSVEETPPPQASFLPLTVAQANVLPQRQTEIYLNGTWQFTPATGTTDKPPTAANWGSIWVPGDWQRENKPNTPGLISRGTGAGWENFNASQLVKAWYQRSLEIPANWQGRTIQLDLTRVSTDAVVYVNGINCGEVPWPYGRVDITKAVKPGPNTLSILVLAVAEEKDKASIATSNQIYSDQGKLTARGLIGEVRLLSFPPGPSIRDIFVQPSTRQKTLKLDVEIAGVTQSGQVEAIAQLLNEKGEVEKQFAATTAVQAKPLQTINLQWEWANPRLWDLQKPNLYTLRLQLKGSGIDTQSDQSFGFREFWIEGRKFFLNGTEIRLRPILFAEDWETGIPEVIDRMIQGYFWAGFNIAELWPWSHDERGRWHFRELIAEQADRQGFLLMGPALDVTHIGWSRRWNNRSLIERWKQRMVVDLRRYRNHPSVVFWITSANFFGNGDDQNPRRIGMKQVVGSLGEVEDRALRERTALGQEAIAAIKQQDPTRPVTVHQGGTFGDIYALNNYLNLIPLQEREEWLSEWSQKGEEPYMAVEFGTPLHATMMRNRSGFGDVIVSEPLMTEFTAIYFGKQAYEWETKEYRAKIREQFVADQKYKSWHLNQELDYSQAFQQLQQLFNTHTWRSWRTFGMTGGMIPWNNIGHGWDVSDAGRQKIDLPPFQPGHRGVYLKQVSKHRWENLQPTANIIYPSGQAILQNNGPTLAWIAGPKPTWVAKDHNFMAGAKLEKQAVLINDTREKQNFSCNWKVTVGRQVLSVGQNQGRINPADTLFFPIDAKLPESFPNKTEGEVYLQATIGNRKHEDRFTFRVFPKLPKASGTVMVFDPVGKTSQMLLNLGLTLVPWENSQKSGVLVVGREAFSSREKWPGDVEEFVRNGGWVVIFPQKREWLQNQGFRYAEHLSRRVFPVDETHPVVSGLEAGDLRDWTGESTLVEAYPNRLYNPPKLNFSGEPWYGWHWGNRGTVSSASVEKPHRSGWRPILESEFDLAYSPLLELDYGKGRVILNTLDLEDHYQVDPAAAQIAQQLMSYAQIAPLSAKANKVVLIGNDQDAIQLDQLGVIYEKATTLVADANLIIVGSETKIKDEELRRYLNGGGKAFFLPRRSSILGVDFQETQEFGGALSIPKWPEMRGMSASDLRTRSFYKTWTIQAGGEVAAEGLLSRVSIGNGVAIFSQINPDALNADQQTYFRYTRWRQTRAIAQILANLGASFKADEMVELGRNQPYYHPDYRTDFKNGDDPYRYYRW